MQHYDFCQAKKDALCSRIQRDKTRKEAQKGQLDATPWLDMALDGYPEETKVRVLEIIQKYKIDENDEFFVLFVAFGHLQVLIEDTPQDWQELFLGFEQQLFAWTETNLKTLASLRENPTLTQEYA